MKHTINKQINIIRNINGWCTDELSQIACQALIDQATAEDIDKWTQKVFPPTPQNRAPPTISAQPPTTISRKKQRHYEYRKVQRLFKTSISRAVSYILKDEQDNVQEVPADDLFNYWGSYFEQPSTPAAGALPSSAIPDPQLMTIMDPVEAHDLIKAKISNQSAAGPDGVSPRQ